ncbi:MAG: glycosyltransferase family 39 protein [Pseudarcicella sp.]|nr:glycosyltransferase family 39 protein [Pseudarcicella sp.]MBP6410302.1 glycosyltransferase family 39 protein [Pseudarcicella sp.]
MSILYLLLFIAFVVAVFKVARQFSSGSVSETVLITFTLFVSCIIVTGFTLSALNFTHHTTIWSLAVFLPLGVIGIISKLLIVNNSKENLHFLTILKSFKTRYLDLDITLRIIFGCLLGTFLFVEIINLLLIIYTVPNEWDSMTGHLNRLLYYIQHHTMAHFGGTNWNIDTYPKSVCNVQIYSYLMTSKSENAFKLIHHLSYLMMGVATYGIVSRISKNVIASLFSALVVLLLPNLLMQVISTESDIVLGAYLSTLVYFLLSYKETRKLQYLYFSGICFGLAFGHKITFAFSLPPLAFIFWYAIFLDSKFKILNLATIKEYFTLSKFRIKAFIFRLKHLVFAVFIGLILFTFPTGYIKNIQVFGHPIGPPTALKHQSIERAGSKKNLLIQGSRNVIRYGFDFFNLDGFRNISIGNKINNFIKKPFVALERKSPLHLETKTEFTIIPFTYSKRYEFYNCNPFWGIFGFALLLPLLIISMFKFKNIQISYLVFGIAFLLHFLALSYTAPYDPWKGRYTISTIVFAVVFFVKLFDGNRLRTQWLNIYLVLITVIGCVSAILTIIYNERCYPFSTSTKKSAFKTDRLAMLTIVRPDLYDPYMKFNKLVPQNAVVALATINDDFEYPLWGDKLTRKIYAVNPFEKGLQSLPADTEYLFFAKSVISPIPGDLRLSNDKVFKDIIVKAEDYYLRKIK